jgi:hypothetical protein
VLRTLLAAVAMLTVAVSGSARASSPYAPLERSGPRLSVLGGEGQPLREPGATETD